MSAGYKDYYSVLGVPRTADEKEIKAAYRKLARKHHPDVNPDSKTAEESFKEVSEAYAVLSDKEKRAKYDQYGQYWEQAGNTGGPQSGNPWGGANFDFGNFGGVGGHGGRTYDVGGGSGFSDFFEMLFGAQGFGQQTQQKGRRSARAERGHNVETELEVDLEDIYHGATKAVSIDGRRIEVTIPKGVGDGQKIRLANQGGDGAGGKGDLLIKLHSAKHSVYERRGNDLYMDLPVDYLTAALGGEIQIPTLGKKITMKIPAGTNAGRTFRLPGMGMPLIKSSDFGDLYAKVRIAMPDKISPEEHALLEQVKNSCR